MKWRLITLLVVFAGILFVAVNPTILNRIKQLLSYSACSTPLSYKIGSIDPRFGLSDAEVQQDITEATGIWETAEEKKLFVYSPQAELSVNFVYDKRQALNSQIQQLDNNLTEKNATLQKEIDAYNAQVAAYEQKIAAFKALVAKYNKEGGAPPDVYDSLMKQQSDLQSEGEVLNATAKQLNLSTHDYNATVGTLNTDITKLNAALAQKPEEGLYNGKDLTITIYLSNSHKELVHTLAHEFGHALGMEHVEGKTSIMYPYTSESLNVSSSDMEQLSFVCRQQSLIVHDAYVADMWLIAQVQHIRQTLSK